MAWTVCSACGLKYSDRASGCPRCAFGGGGASSSGPSGSGLAARWWRWVVGAGLALVAYRTFLATTDAMHTGVFDDFWRIFFGVRR